MYTLYNWTKLARAITAIAALTCELRRSFANRRTSKNALERPLQVTSQLKTQQDLRPRATFNGRVGVQNEELLLYVDSVLQQSDWKLGKQNVTQSHRNTKLLYL